MLFVSLFLWIQHAYGTSTCVHVQVNARGGCWLPCFHHSPLYSLEAGSLTEPGARLEASKVYQYSWPPASTAPELQMRVWLFTWMLKIPTWVPMLTQ